MNENAPIEVGFVAVAENVYVITAPIFAWGDYTGLLVLYVRSIYAYAFEFSRTMATVPVICAANCPVTGKTETTWAGFGGTPLKLWIAHVPIGFALAVKAGRVPDGSVKENGTQDSPTTPPIFNTSFTCVIPFFDW